MIYIFSTSAAIKSDTIKSDIVRELLELPPGGCEFGPQQPSAAARQLLRKLTPNDVTGGKPADVQMAQAAIAGLWLRHGCQDESHAISQDLETVEGSYWHGILHRREPDYGNAKYWFRRVGKHPVFATISERLSAALADETLSLAGCDSAKQVESLGRNWDGLAFVDLCQQAARSGNALDRAVCEALAELEWQSLFAWCCEQA